MDSVFISSSLSTPFASQFSPPNQNSAFLQFATRRHTKIRISSKKSQKRLPKFFPLTCSFGNFSSPEACVTSRCCREGEKAIVKAPEVSKGNKQSVNLVTKCIVYALFCIAASFSPVATFRVPAVAAPVISEWIFGRKDKMKQKEREYVLKSKNHEYSDYTSRLLEKVSSLLKSIDEVKRGNGDERKVNLALKEVRKRKEELQDEIMSGMYRALGEMKTEKELLMNRGDVLVDEVLKVQREIEDLKGEDKAEKLEMMRTMERDYEEVWERVGEIEDDMVRKETVALSVGVRELCFIERECEELVKRFNRELKRKSTER